MTFNPGANSINGSTDAAVSNPANDDVLVYDTTYGKWRNAPNNDPVAGMSKVIVLDATAPIPAGTPAGTPIIRRPAA